MNIALMALLSEISNLVSVTSDLEHADGRCDKKKSRKTPRR